MIAPPRRLARSLLGCVLTAAVLLTGNHAAATPASRDETRRHFQLAARTAGATVWAERCSPTFSTRSSAAVRTASRVRTLPQPDAADLSALMSALRRSDFVASGVRIVETAEGPMLELAGRRPGAPMTYFMLCNAAIRTSYE